MLTGQQLDDKLYGYIVEGNGLKIQRTVRSATAALGQYGVTPEELHASVERLASASKITVGPGDNLNWWNRASR